MPDTEQQRRSAAVLDHIDKVGDGYIFCVDLDHEEGWEAREVLRNAYPEVANSLIAIDRVRASTPLKKVHIRYLLALIPKEGRVSTWFSHEQTLPKAIQMLHEQSCQLGGMWALAIIPMSQQIAEMFTKFSTTAGSA